MSQAEELLNSMSTEIPVHSHPVPDTDTYFIIDPITRKIENTNRKKTVIMQYDHNSERFTFELPRFIDGHDMLECTSATVNVDNIEAETGITNSDASDMTDLRTHPSDPEKVLTSWLLSRSSTQLAGSLSFHIEFKCVDSNGNVVYEWSTDTFNEIEIRARKKNGEVAVIEYTDLLEQWRTKIFGAADSVLADIVSEGEAQVAAVQAESETQQEAVELKGTQTLETIPEDYTAVDAMAAEAVRTKGDAIVCESSGDTIILKDSSDDHIRGLKLFGKSGQVTTTGKNLLDDSKFEETNSQGVLVTRNIDGSFHASGTANTEYVSLVRLGRIELKAGERYLITGAVSNMRLTLRDESSGSVYIDDNGEGASYVPSADMTAYLNIRVEIGGSINTTFYPMIRLAIIEDGTWEPYTGGNPAPNPEFPQEIESIENPITGVYGTNLIDPDKLDCVLNKSLSVSDDKYTITVVGGADKTYAYSYYNMPDDLVRLLGGRHLRVSIDSTTKSVTNAYSPVQINITCDDKTSLYPACHSGHLYHDFVLPKNATQVKIGIYTNNSSNLLETDNIVVVKGLRLTLVDSPEYEPYKPYQTITLPRSIPGIPVTSGGNYTDSNGQQWICDEIDLERGVHVQRTKTINPLDYADYLVYSDNSVYSDTILRFDIGYSLDSMTKTTILSNILPYKFAHGGDAPSVRSTECVSSHSTSDVISIFIDRSRLNTYDVDGFVEYLTANEMTILYAVKTPIETPLTADEITAFKALRTNYPNTTILNDAGAWMSVKYNADTKTYVENPKTFKLVDSSTGVVYELKIVDGSLTVTPV